MLIFVLQAASAAFTPTFQATIPDVLPNEKDYTKALSLSRLAYDMESLVSPMLAAALLTVIGFHDLFAGTVVGFLASAALVVFVVLPTSPATQRRGIYDRTTRGLRIYLATPRLRGLLAVNAAVAAAGSMVFVNTVVMVQAGFGLTQSAVALALASFGAGSMVAALVLPRLLEKDVYKRQEQAKHQRCDLGVGLEPQPSLVRTEVVQRLVNHGQADDRVDEVAVDSDVEGHAQPHPRRVTNCEQRHVKGNLSHAVPEKNHAEQEQDVVIAGRRVHGTEVHERQQVDAGDFLDEMCIRDRSR